MEDNEELGDIENEITMLEQCNHPNVVAYYGSFSKDKVRAICRMVVRVCACVRARDCICVCVSVLCLCLCVSRRVCAVLLSIVGPTRFPPGPSTAPL